ncbi:DUF3040 domain-containing protein [Saccharopolyspora indica]|uniref:DUF3040 domain-containing protein n=1 Tax=Saccharopolyspora indica TaxID=1229659 RepID=UPI0022EADE43|nr:DUF3040 domain-containing protein [Saccharopolyspora indica]MDA3648500.1 DUF3040 domain-containing protein [Saccharopolyspora indica]
MLPKDERRRLKEIENQLMGEDPKLARRLTETSSLRRLWLQLSPRSLLVLVAAVLAVLCLFLGEGGGMFFSAVLAVLVFASRKYQIRLE